MYVKRKRAQIHTVPTRNLPQGKVGRFMGRPIEDVLFGVRHAG